MTVKLSVEEDFAGREVYKITSTREKITRKVALEALQQYGYVPGILIMVIQTQQLSADLYDNGDVWELYNPDTMKGPENMLVPGKPVNGKCPMCVSPVSEEYTYCPFCGQLLK